MQNFIQFVKDNSVAISAFVVAVVALIRDLFSTRMRQKWQTDSNREIEGLKNGFNHEIENLKADRQKDSSIVSSLLSQQGLINQKILDKRIAAVETAWDCTMQFSRSMPSALSFINKVLLDSEIDKTDLDKRRGGTPSVGSQIRGIDLNAFLESHSQIIDRVVKLRPFLPETAFKLIYVHGSVIGRITFVQKNGYEKANIEPWRKDPATRNLLSSVLLENELGFIYDGKDSPKYEEMILILEAKILNEFNKMFSGSGLAKNALELSIEWQKMSKDEKGERIEGLPGH